MSAAEQKTEDQRRLASDAKRVRELEDMLQTPGWKIYSELLEHHIREKTNQALQPLSPIMQTVSTGPGQGMAVETLRDGLAHCLVGEAAKGAILGLRLALSLPSGIVTSFKAQKSPSAEE